MDTLEGLLRAVAADPWCGATRLVLADWYAEYGIPADRWREAQCREPVPPVHFAFVPEGCRGEDCLGPPDTRGDGYYRRGPDECDGGGRGDGNGEFYGAGDGFGGGTGGLCYGYCHGYGHGDGHLYKRGDAVGGAVGSGGGYGICDPRITFRERAMPEADGKNWLIVLPHGWVICGRVVEQTGPFSFRVEDASVICTTGGTPWDRLADGEGREGAGFRPWGEVRIGPQFVMSRRWVGELPGTPAERAADAAWE